MTSDLNLWRLFLELAASGSLSKTAASQNRVHSSISRQLAVLEKECGGPLFYRTGRGVVLTELGAALLPEATSLLAQADRLDARAQAGREGLPGYVRVGMLPSLIQLAASHLAKELLTKHPGLSIGMVEGSNQHLASLLAQGRLDLALVYRPQRNLDLTDEVLRAIPLLLVGPPDDNVLSGKDVIKFQDLAGLTLISPPGPASQVRSMLERHAASRGLVLTFGMEADSLSLQKVLVQAGMGYAALAATACESDVREGRLSAAKLVDPELSLTLALCRATSAPMTESARQCAKIIRRLVRDMIV